MYEVPAAKTSADDYLTGQTLAKIESGPDTLKTLEEKKIPGAKWLDQSNNQVSDDFSRVNEDPMFAIKKQEIEIKKKTLSNPLQLRRIKEKLIEKGCVEKAKIIDALLKKATGAIRRKHNESSSSSESEDEDKKKKKKSSHHHHHSHSKKHHHHKSHKNRSRSSSSSGSEREDEKKKKEKHSHSKHNRNHKRSVSSSSSSSSSSSRSRSRSRSRSKDRKDKKKAEDITQIKKNYKRDTGLSKTLTKEERDAKIAEMLKDGKINEDLRWNRLMKHEKKEKDEELEESKNPSFLRDINKQAFSVSEDNDGSIAERIQRRKNYVMDMREEP